MKGLLCLLGGLIVLAMLVGCSAEAAEIYSLEGKSESWEGSLVIEEGDLKEEVSEVTNWELEYTGESEIGAVNVHYPVESEVATAHGVYSLEGNTLIKENLENQKFLSLLQKDGKIAFEMEWIENGKPIREKIEFTQ